MSTRFVTLALTTVITPDTSGPDATTLQHLAALAMLVVEQVDEGWQFSLSSRAIAAGDGEDALLSWATDNLPVSGIAIGWRLADDVVAPLLAATRECDPEIAPLFLDRLIGLVTAPAVDLSVHRGGAGAPDLSVIAAEHGIATVVMSPADIETAWAVGDRDRLARHTRAQALAAWRLWLADAPADEFPAKTAFMRWLAGADDAEACAEGGQL